jgi:hypothetical protein
VSLINVIGLYRTASLWVRYTLCVTNISWNSHPFSLPSYSPVYIASVGAGGESGGQLGIWPPMNSWRKSNLEKEGNIPNNNKH